MSKAYVTGRNILLEIFPITEPYCYTAISYDPIIRQARYEIIEPLLVEEEIEALSKIKQHLEATISYTLSELGTIDDAAVFLRETMEEADGLYKLQLSQHSKDKLMYYLSRDHLSFGKMDAMMKDPLIEDISCNGPEIPVYIWHRTYESIPSNLQFESDQELDSYIIRLAYKAKRMISVANPLLDASLPDGSRVQLTYSKYVTKKGSTYTIRKFKADPLTIVDLINYGTISPEMAALLWFVVENKCSIFVCGGVASGKTTMLNCLSSFIAPDSKIVTIEDTPEVQLYHKNWIRAVTRPSTGSSEEISLFDLLKASMRQRPDYILVGEIRGEEAYTLFQAMSTGHLGLATLHAESVDAALRRLETAPMNIPRMMVAGLNMVLIMARREIDGNPVRKVIACSEVKGMKPNGDIDVSTLFEWNAMGNIWQLFTESYYLQKAAKMRGITVEEAKNDIRMRAEILNYLAEEGMRSFPEVTEVIRNYVKAPETAHESLTTTS
ncbi:MAG: type II/IV secretion system ATPase subunit [Candidatus Bathyarchaeota archaeon]|nr:MAG: type II/IV secretion system ATPase subunit [Candidatus Bathyarchaeota archaeon]